MARSLVGSNLNQFGNNGHFETDPSTWGFSIGSISGVLARKPYGYDGINNMSFAYDGVITPEPEAFMGGLPLCTARFAQVLGKKYIVSCYIHAANDLHQSMGPIKFKVSMGPVLPPLSGIFYTADAGAVYQRLEALFVGTYTGNGYVDIVIQEDSGAATLDINAEVFIDTVEIYEYIDVVIPCTLAIDTAATTVTDETTVGAHNGTITLEVSGGIAPFEYSKDNGATWQPSKLFTGLAPGVYACSVRETTRISCVATQSFAINSTGYTFSVTEDITNESMLGAHDGAALITVTGTVAPFTFSMDSGVSFQASNNFTGLSPGTYTLVVKDATGLQRAKNITINAGLAIFENVYFSKNPIVYTAQATAGWMSLDNYRLYDNVRIEEVYGSSVFTSKLSVDYKPDTTGQVTFQVREAFRKLQAIPPAFNTTTILRLTDRIRYFKHYLGELQGINITPDTLTPSMVQLVMLGEIDKFNYPTLDYFKTYLPATKKFMSWAPLTKRLTHNQEDYLNFWIYAPTIRLLNLIVKVSFDDGSEQTTTVLSKVGTVYGELYQIPAGINTGVLLIDAIKNVTAYQLWLTDQDNTVISEIRTYTIDAFQLPNTRLFMFLNSLGSYEVLSFHGQAELQKSFDRNTIVKYLPIGYNPLDGESQNNRVIVNKKGSHSSGYFKGSDAAQWNDYMTDFMLSTRVYEITDGKRRPVTIVDGTIDQADQNYNYFFRFTVLDAYANQSYTPTL